MKLEFVFKKDDDKEWELLEIDASETDEHLPSRKLIDMFFRGKIVENIIEMLKEKDSFGFKTAFVTIPYPSEDVSNMTIAYFPLTIDEMHNEMEEDINS